MSLLADDPFNTAAAAQEASKALLQLSQENCPVSTGGTRDSLEIRTGASSGGVSVELWGSIIGQYLIGGTRAHSIDVVNASVLTDGVSFFGRHVNHPGTSPQDFRRPVAAAMVPILHKLGLDSANVAISNIKRRVKAI